MAEKVKWTKQQELAIRSRGSDVLVTASAGTGKTSVLSGRCVDIVTDKSLCPDIWSLLVLTFTDAAAEQMRSRIAEQLAEACQKAEDAAIRNHLRKQLILLPAADISTIHSFCKRLITENFHVLGLDPTFRVLDGDEQSLIKADILEKTVEWAWQQDNLKQALVQLLYKRNPQIKDGFLSSILQISNFLDGVVSRSNWYERALKFAVSIEPLTGDLGQRQKQMVGEKVNEILDRIHFAQRLCKSVDADNEWLLKSEQLYIEPVAECAQLLEKGDWQRCAERIRNFEKPMAYKPKNIEPDLAEIIQSSVRDAMNLFEGLKGLAVINPDYMDKVDPLAGLQVRVLVELVKKFDQFYTKAKGAINCLDFADLEHFALKLLSSGNNGEDELIASETAISLRERYKYIFVDEYQDINPVQQAILKMLTAGKNLFVVGDAKQSIYAFRGAEPGIFIDQLKESSAQKADISKAVRIDLNENFRSQKGILDFVNIVFTPIMTEAFSNIDYDESARLKTGSEEIAETKNTPLVELYVLDEKSKDEKEENDEDKPSEEESGFINARQRQAALVARRIQQIVENRAELQIYDKYTKQMRAVQYGDIAILMRSPAARVNTYVEVFRLAGIPVSSDSAGGYFEATEIADCLSLLKVLDNQQRDIELATILRGPLFKLTDTELAQIKINTESKANFCECLVKYCEQNSSMQLGIKLKTILETIERWRTLSRRINLAGLIWQIFTETNIFSFVSALPNGRFRKANLLKLHDRAIQFTHFSSGVGVGGLSRFIEFIDRLREGGREFAEEPCAQDQDAVHILSIHKSKGLEFPVVFVVELNSPFKKNDSNSGCITDALNTIGLQVVDPDSNTSFDTAAHQIIAENKLKIDLAEEMRILYVALTRAKEKLILVGSEGAKKCNNILRKGIYFEGKIPHWQLRTCSNSMQWILYGLSSQRVLHDAFQTGLKSSAVNEQLFSFNLYDRDKLEELSEYVGQLRKNKIKSQRHKKGKNKNPKLLEKITKSLNWQYGFEYVSKIPAKTSVSQLTHRNDEYTEKDFSNAFFSEPKVVSAEYSKRPGADVIGSAVHLILASLDISKQPSKEDIQKTIDMLSKDQKLPQAVGQFIDIDAISDFFKSQLGKKVISCHEKVLREWPFSFAMPASKWRNSGLSEDSKAEGDIVIVQGIIDMIVPSTKGLLIIDFKTDRVSAGNAQTRAENYRRQLELYAQAAEKILKTNVAGKYVYFLNQHLSIEIKD